MADSAAARRGRRAVPEVSWLPEQTMQTVLLPGPEELALRLALRARAARCHGDGWPAQWMQPPLFEAVA